jgi:hypothetical protein
LVTKAPQHPRNPMCPYDLLKTPWALKTSADVGCFGRRLNGWSYSIYPGCRDWSHRMPQARPIELVGKFWQSASERYCCCEQSDQTQLPTAVLFNLWQEFQNWSDDVQLPKSKYLSNRKSDNAAWALRTLRISLGPPASMNWLAALRDSILHVLSTAKPSSLRIFTRTVQVNSQSLAKWMHKANSIQEHPRTTSHRVPCR